MLRDGYDAEHIANAFADRLNEAVDNEEAYSKVFYKLVDAWEDVIDKAAERYGLPAGLEVEDLYLDFDELNEMVAGLFDYLNQI